MRRVLLTLVSLMIFTGFQAKGYDAVPAASKLLNDNSIVEAVNGGSNILVNNLPADLPLPIVDTINNPSPEGIFLSPFGPAATDTGSYKNYLMILDSACNVVSYKLLPYPSGYVGYHFKEEPNGLLSYMARKLDGIINVTDTSYNVITSFKDTTNPYNRVRYFAHFDLLPNGHYLDVRYDFQYVDLTKYFPKGEPNGAVLQAVVQELDKDRNVVFQWRSLDYVPVSQTFDNVTPAIDYFHPNSMVLDNDGNILLSGRDICSILKLDRNTGDIIWQLGGKKNDFTITGETEANAPNYFSYQHDIRRLSNGNITMFDNGRQHKPQYSRAVEYSLDEANKTANMVWEYRHSPDFFADQHGSTQRMPNGNTLIAWGTYSMNGGTALTELHPDNSIALEMHFPPGLESQFIYKYPWPVCRKIASVTNKEMLELNTYDFNNDSGKTGLKLTFNALNAFTYNSLTVDRYDCSPMNPDFTGRAPIVSPYRLVLKPDQIYSMKAELRLNISGYPWITQPAKTLVYLRPVEGQGAFKPLTTTYDSDTKELVASIDTTGEIILAYPDLPVITKGPILLFPPDNYEADVNNPLKFSWNPRGYFIGSLIEVATDTDFTDLVDSVALKDISAKLSFDKKDTKYYWRVRSINEAGAGEWSEVRSFTMADPYIKITTPVGGEVWSKDSTKRVIRWEYNLTDSVDQVFKVELYRNNQFVRIMKDSLFSAVNAFGWIVPAAIPEDTTYQIRVSSVRHPELSSTSPAFFTIGGGTSVENNYQDSPDIDMEVYPNPMSNKTSFVFSSRVGGNASLKIYSIEGKELAPVMDGYLEPGNYSLNWTSTIKSPGVYFYVLKIGSASKSGKIVIID